MKSRVWKREDPIYLNSNSVLFGSLFGSYILYHDQGQAVVVSQLQNVFIALL